MNQEPFIVTQEPFIVTQEPFNVTQEPFIVTQELERQEILRQGQDFPDYEAQMKWQWEIERVKTIFTDSIVFLCIG